MLKKITLPRERVEDWTAAIVKEGGVRCTAQADAFQSGIPSAHVVRLPNADHCVFRSNEADTLRERTPSSPPSQKIEVQRLARLQSFWIEPSVRASDPLM